MQALGFHPSIERWFRSTFGDPTEPQAHAWPAIRAREHTLIAAPTGSGKTLAAFLAALDDLFVRALEGPLADETAVLYISPLKALSNDIHKNLEQPLAGIAAQLAQDGFGELTVRAAVRTGDTPAAERQRHRKRPPHVLVTTPESFYLLLTSEGGRRMLRTVRTVIVDEIHALAGNRRGAHLALSLERLEHLRRSEGVTEPLQRIGLSATQKPIEDVARFLCGVDPCGADGGAADDAPPPCRIVDSGHRRALDIRLEVPSSPLESVMAHEVWAEIYERVVQMIEAHKTTLIFVNTRRLAERVAHDLSERLGPEAVTAHHGSLSTKTRHRAEQRLKNGELRALVATASLELGIDIGAVDLVVQLGAPRSISVALQRIGRSGHTRGGTPKGRIFPLSRDELVDCTALCRCIAQGELDRLHVPVAPLDVLAQQIVAMSADGDWGLDDLYAQVRHAYPYRALARERFDALVHMLADGFTTRRGRRGAYLHLDAVNGRVRGRRGARLTALQNGGAIPENADYRVEQDPEGTFVGTINEDFAIESMAGDIFQLGNTAWQITQVTNGTVRVRDAQGAPPTIPFWLGEAPARSDELSLAVSALRAEADALLASAGVDGEGRVPTAALTALTTHLAAQPGGSPEAAVQLCDYFVAARAVLGVLPTQTTVVMERFFDEAGGMQLVIHAPFGGRVNRAWGLALRKRFCRTFNFELQAAANEDAIVLSLGETHSFPLDDVARFLHPNTVRDVLVQALLDAPMFQTRWRWNTNRALAVLRRRSGKKVPANIQRMEAEDLVAVVFPDQLACLENIKGEREIPDHPLVQQTIGDCLVEAMDIDALEALLRRLVAGEIRCEVRDLPEPSCLAHEIINARPYAFLDDAPLEERRTRAVSLRRTLDAAGERELGALDAAAIEAVIQEAQPLCRTPDELHEALMLCGVLDATRLEERGAGAHLTELVRTGRAACFTAEPGAPERRRVVAAERSGEVRAAYPGVALVPPVEAPGRYARPWESDVAVREIVRSQLEVSGPTTANELAAALGLPLDAIDAALGALEGEGFVLRGRFRASASGADAPTEWCERRLLARIHRRTLNRLRAEVQPVPAATFMRFLFAWQGLSHEHRRQGPQATAAVIAQLQGCEVAAAAWEEAVLPARISDYRPEYLDRLGLRGELVWGRLSVPSMADGRAFAAGPLRSSPIALLPTESAPAWIAFVPEVEPPKLTAPATRALEVLRARGASFARDVERHSGLLGAETEAALGELAALGLITSDSVAGLRALLMPLARRRRRGARLALEAAGRWSLFDRARPSDTSETPGWGVPFEAEVEVVARALLARYGVVFRALLDYESALPPWRDLARVYRRLEARGELRGGRFVEGFSGEQFARPDAVTLMRSIRRDTASGESDTARDEVVLNATDPLNLTGVLEPRRVAATLRTEILFRGGRAVALREGERIEALTPDGGSVEALRRPRVTARTRARPRHIPGWSVP